MSFISHANLISESRELAMEIFKLEDRFEKDLNRTVKRLVGFVLSVLLPGALWGVDAMTDQNKLAKIKDRLTCLEISGLDTTRDDYSVAVSACNFQKKVCENIADYTRTAQKIKIVVVGGMLLSAGFAGSVSGGQEGGVSSFGGLVAFSAVIYGLYHRFCERPQLHLANQKLAEQVLKKPDCF